jgi:hypothetical protein
MNKKDRLLAEKTLLARKMKWESKRPGTTYDPAASLRNSTGSLPKMKKSSSLASTGSSTMNSNNASSTQYMNTATLSSPMGKTDDYSSSVSFDNTIDESKLPTSPMGRSLGQRSMTVAGGLRKMHQLTAIEVNKQASEGTLSFGDSYFIPKTKLMRPDGASLSDVYESKRNDAWAAILKASVRENAQAEKDGIRSKYESDQAFGRQLRAQVASNGERRDVDKELGEQYARIVEETSRKNDEIQQKRKADAVARHKQFINNAIVDMEIKRRQNEAFLRSEIEASTLMICAAKKKAEEEEEKKAEMKRRMKADQERRYQENLEALKRKEQERQKLLDEEKKLAREAEERAQREIERREADLHAKMVRTTEGPVHAINRDIMAVTKQRTEEFYRRNESVPNSLNLQLQQSEDGANKRATADSKYLCKDWDANMRHKKAEKLAEQKWIEKVGEDMKKIIQKNVEQDLANKQKHKQACLKYQHDLDDQLGDLRQRSLKQLTETMSERERAINRQLIQKSERIMGNY